MATGKSKEVDRNAGSLTIGQVAKLAGVGIETIRFYEREGIIGKPHRRESGYREFSPNVVSELRFIKRAQELGFSLKEIAELLVIRVDPTENCSPVKRKAEAKISEIRQKIGDLKRMQRVLEKVTRACIASKPITECPILDCFEHASNER
jgi:MerR family copper efflux transcriptional regulator